MTTVQGRLDEDNHSYSIEFTILNPTHNSLPLLLLHLRLQKPFEHFSVAVLEILSKHGVQSRHTRVRHHAIIASRTVFFSSLCTTSSEIRSSAHKLQGKLVRHRQKRAPVTQMKNKIRGAKSILVVILHNDDPVPLSAIHVCQVSDPANQTFTNCFIFVVV